MNNNELSNVLDKHRKATSGNPSFKEMEIGYLYKKEIDNFIFYSLEGLSCQPIHDSKFSNCIFNHVDFYKTELFGSVFTNCIFVNCSFVKANMQRGKLYNCLFVNCNLFRLLIHGNIDGCIFNNCKLDKMILTGSQIINTIFTGKSEPPNTNDNEEHNVIWDIS